MRRILYGLAAMAVALAVMAGCSGDWRISDDNWYYSSACPRHRTYGPLNCNNCHW